MTKSSAAFEVNTVDSFTVDVTGEADHKELLRRVNILTLLFIEICACAVTFFATSRVTHLLFVGCLMLLFLFMNRAKMGLVFVATYVLMTAWLTINITFGIRFPSPMFFTLIIEMIPLFMPAYLLLQTPSGKLNAGLRQLPLPPQILLTVMVILRFAPTIASELSDVKDAMRTRGLLRSPLQIIRHPLATFEYAVVPMVFRMLKIADELGSSCIVRGIESPCKKQSYYLNEKNLTDLFMALIFLAVSVFCIGVLG